MTAARARGVVFDAAMGRRQDPGVVDDGPRLHENGAPTPEPEPPGPSGTTQAWIGNAGIVVDKASDASWTLRCSDGVGPTNFDDLVVHVVLE